MVRRTNDDDAPPKPGDEGWGDWADEQLDDIEYDRELGKSMARDAIRVSEGTFTRADFHERYHEQVVREFGIDDRPTKAEFEAERGDTEERADGPIPGVPETDDAPRRGVLKAMGVVTAMGATAGLAGHLRGGGPAGGREGTATAAGAVEHEGDDVQLGMAVDTETCIACLQCSIACKEENDTDVSVHWPYVFRYEDEHAGGTREGYLSRHCQHCSEPSCTYVCPTQARYKRTDDGLVLTNYDTCIGCRYCQVACPYGVNYLGQDKPNRDVSDGFDGDQVGGDDRTVAGPPPKGVMGKCTFCVHRQDSDDPDLQGTTACEQRCPVDAIHFGDMNDPDSDPQQYLQEREDEHQYALLDGVGNEPNIVYIGREPSKDAQPIEGPVSYDSQGMVDGNYDYVVDADDENGGEEA